MAEAELDLAVGSGLAGGQDKGSVPAMRIPELDRRKFTTSKSPCLDYNGHLLIRRNGGSAVAAGGSSVKGPALGKTWTEPARAGP
jgi:hypothetical protein